MVAQTMKNILQQYSIHTHLKGLFHTPLLYCKSTTTVMDDARIYLTKTDTLPSPSHGTTLYAACQTSARGQQGKQWHSPSNTSLSIAVVLKKPLTQNSNGLLSLQMGLALHKCIQKIAHNALPNIHIKWPNDVLIGSKKIAGILIESYKNWYIGGIGVNIHCAQYLKSLPFLFQATSLSECGIQTASPTNVYMILTRFLEEILHLTPDTIRHTVQKHLYGLHKHIRVRHPDNTITEGILTGISHNGALLLDNGSTMIHSGSIVTIVK